MYINIYTYYIYIYKFGQKTIIISAPHVTHGGHGGADHPQVLELSSAEASAMKGAMFTHQSPKAIALCEAWDILESEDDYKAAGATRVVALVKEDLEQEVQEFRPSAVEANA